MSRSFKKAIITISKKLGFKAHKVARQRVKAKLRKINSAEVDGLTLLDIEADTKEMGLDDWGTKIGWEFYDEKNEDDIQEIKKEQRK